MRDRFTAVVATGAAASSASAYDDSDVYGEEEAAADQAAGLPRFSNRQERREHWIHNHPEAAKKFREKTPEPFLFFFNRLS